MSKENKKNIGVGIIIAVIIAILIYILVLLTNGRIITTDKENSDVSSQYTTCYSQDIFYPFFSYDKSTKKDLSIKILFENNRYSTISLSQNLFYSNDQDATASRDINTSTMNTQLGSDGFSSHKLNSHFQIIDNEVLFNLFASGSEYNQTTAKYFLLDTNDGKLATTQEDIYNTLSNKGLDCSIKD